MPTTTDDVRDALRHIDSIETENSDVANGLRVAVSESDIGAFYQAVRENGLNVSAKRLNDSLVAHIEAEETNSLADLFG